MSDELDGVTHGDEIPLSKDSRDLVNAFNDNFGAADGGVPLASQQRVAIDQQGFPAMPRSSNKSKNKDDDDDDDEEEEGDYDMEIETGSAFQAGDGDTVITDVTGQTQDSLLKHKRNLNSNLRRVQKANGGDNKDGKLGQFLETDRNSSSKSPVRQREYKQSLKGGKKGSSSGGGGGGGDAGSAAE